MDSHTATANSASCSAAYLLQPWSSQHEIEIAAVVASPVDTAPVGPDLDVWQVIAEQGFESAPML